MVESMNEGTKESGTITIKKDSLWKYSTLLLVAVVVIGGFLLLRDGSGGTTGAAIGNEQQPSINARALIEDNDPVLGDPNAEISIIEFSDFECPFCARAHEGALAEFRQSSYFTNGEVNLIYKQFPLNSIHPQAQGAAEASLCAASQGKFWEYHDLLFANQASLGTESLKQYASQLGLNTAEFNSCLDDGDFESEVNKETAQATAAGGRGTPFFVIVNTKTGDHETVSGAYPWTQFESAISSVQ
ncbi:MAG: thioredoxin domain-containing protein [Nanoarchaeota archaeon]|nr:thioredoxin domain-containing protein [Nanoarchaeota archaeon]